MFSGGGVQKGKCQYLTRVQRSSKGVAVCFAQAGRVEGCCTALQLWDSLPASSSCLPSCAMLNKNVVAV